MKRKVIALVSTLLVCGSVGAYAAGGNTYFSGQPTASAQPVQAVLAASASKSCPTSISSALNKVLASKSSSSCPTSGGVNSSAAKAVQAAIQQAKSKSSSCPSSSKAAPSSSSAVSPASAASNSTSSSCKASGAGNVYTYVTSPSDSSYSSYQDWLNSILNSYYKSSSCPKTTTGTTSSTSSKVTSSAPAASSKPVSSSSASGSGYSAFQSQVVSLVNQERTSRGLGALSVDAALTNTATLKSQDMVKNNYFDHNSPTYGSPFDMMKQFGITYRTAGENIAMGQKSPTEVMNAWMNSEGHRANILNSSFTKIGVGIAQNANGQYYWTQQFIG